MQRIRSLLLVPATLATLVAGCSDSTGPTEADIRNFIAGLSTSGGVDASFRAGAPPEGGAGPVVTVSGTSAMITGGSSIRSLSSTQSFTRVIVAIAGVDGYWEITLPNAVTAQDVVLTLGQDIPEGTSTVEYAAGTGGSVGTFDTEPVSVVEVGTGEVQVSISWDSNADVDLYVVDPSGEEIFWGNSFSESGGELDLDSNAACAGDNIRNENITWPDGEAPSGTYTVRVNLWAACGATSTSYVVTVRREGQAAQTFTGTLTGEGNGGAEGAGEVVTTFSR